MSIFITSLCWHNLYYNYTPQGRFFQQQIQYSVKFIYNAQIIIFFSVNKNNRPAGMLTGL